MGYDIFNGDADGLCALHQLRLDQPCPDAQLVSGVKRDIRLLEKISGVKDQEITVLDISLDSNRDALEILLENRNTVTYIDHHYAGGIPVSPLLSAHIDTRPETCTSLIVDHLLGGRFRPWAVVAAYGDNLHRSAEEAAAPLALSDRQMKKLQELGELLNYNGYGETVADLHFPPWEIYRAMQPFVDPLAFVEKSELIASLRQGFDEDMNLARACAPILENRGGRVYQLPAESWSRRVSGVFSNERAREKPEAGHALMVENSDGTLRISVRAPIANRKGADELCRAFPTGGGRAAAAGINALPADQLDSFLDSFTRIFTT